MTDYLPLPRRFAVEQAVTRIANRAVRVAHRLIGFGVAAPAGPGDGSDPEFQPLPQDAAMWAELTTERRLRGITRSTYS